MRRMARMFFAAGLLSLSALLPMTALAGGSTLPEYVTGAEYALGTCVGGSTGSFAGYGSATLGGAPNALFNTTICYRANSDGTRTILGGSLTLARSELTLVGQYALDGRVGVGKITPGYFCKEVFDVWAPLVQATSALEDATSISGGLATGQLTHYGLRTKTGACRAYAATITGLATLNY